MNERIEHNRRNPVVPIRHNPAEALSISKNLSNWIRVVSFVCALLIVPIHASFIGRAEMSGATYWTMKILSDGICRVAVPWFFVVSGFFLALTYKGYLLLLKKRFKTLYIPFVMWNIIYFGFQLLNGKGFAHAPARILGHDPFEQVACMQFWYLKTLFVVFLFSPIFIWLVRKLKWCVPTLFLIGWAAHDFGLRLPQMLELSNFFFITLGMLLARELPRLNALVNTPPMEPSLHSRRTRFSCMRVIISLSTLLQRCLRFARFRFWLSTT